MIDIEFYQNVFVKKAKGESIPFYEMESYRSRVPVVYNIETTNACNMRCKMCPRTTMMTRPVETMKPDVFRRVIDQLRPWTAGEWSDWQDFVEACYKIDRNDMSENHFFLHIIPKVIVLHGYGDPLLDKNMPLYVKWMAERGLDSYFSCNPANIDIARTVQTFENGLGYIKYSIESVDDEQHKAIRGQASNFTQSYRNIMQILDYKARRNYQTTIVITMLDLNRENQVEEWERLKEAFSGCDVYIYLKSQDQLWYDDTQMQTRSIHWQEFCQFPWSSMTVKSNGECAMCVEDFQNEIILGDAKTESLYDIWNGEKYDKFRRDHYNLTPGIKCTERCDMKLIGELNA